MPTSHFAGAPKCTSNRYVIECGTSAPWCTCTTLLGMECQNSSGAKHRCGPATDSYGGSCLQSHHNSRGLYRGLRAVCRLLCKGLCCVWSRRLANAQRRCDLLRLWRLQEVLKVAIFGEDIGESLLDNIIGTSMDEGGILIDLSSGRVSEPDRSAYLSCLNHFKKWLNSLALLVRSGSLFSCNHASGSLCNLPRTSGAKCAREFET